MFWSRLWLGLVTLAVGLLAAVALLAQGPLTRDLEREAGARLERAQHAASLILKVNARKWMDTAAQVATDAVLVESLEQATRGPADLQLVHKTVQERLRYFNDKMKVDLVMATDGKGRVIARGGLDEDIYKDGVEGFPLVADTLRGFRGDDTWSLGGKLYRVAASPVIARDRYAGALVVGQEVGKDLAQSMRQVLDVEVAFLLRGRVIAASSPLPVLEQLPGVIDQQAVDLQRSGRSTPLVVGAGAQPYLVVLAPFAGEAALHRAAYALILERPRTATLGSLLAPLASWDKSQMSWQVLAPVGGVVLALLLVGGLLMRLEGDRPLKRLARESQVLARGEIERLDDDRHPGKLGTIARAVNTTLDRLSAASRGSQVAQAWAPARPPSTPLPPPIVPRAYEEKSNPRGATPDWVAPTSAGPDAQDVMPTMDLRGARSRSMPPPIADTDTDPQPTLAPGPDLVDAPGLRPPLLPDRPAPPPLKPDLERHHFAGGPTREPEQQPDAEPIASGDPALDAEFEQVFSEFIETKQRLGEATDGVTFDKFVVKLRANRAQLITRYSCRSVRFQVYVKDGKAALKATPVQS